jgi:hypothetical protein
MKSEEWDEIRVYKIRLKLGKKIRNYVEIYSELSQRCKNNG